jgi:putative transposase
MCKYMSLSRSGYYEWLQNPKCDRIKEDEEITKMIKQVFEEGRGTYGSRRIKKRLAQKKITVSRNLITRLMKESNLVCKTKRKFKATTDSNTNSLSKRQELRYNATLTRMSLQQCPEATIA